VEHETIHKSAGEWKHLQREDKSHLTRRLTTGLADASGTQANDKIPQSDSQRAAHELADGDLGLRDLLGIVLASGVAFAGAVTAAAAVGGGLEASVQWAESNNSLEREARLARPDAQREQCGGRLSQAVPVQWPQHGQS
jgi:hypothetical protein